MSEEFYSLEKIEKLFKDNHKSLCNIAYRIIREKDAAEDIVQEVFIKLWQKREEIEIESTLKGYLFKAVANAALNELQKRKRIQFQNELKDHQIPSTDPGLNEIDQNFLESKVQEAIDELPHKCRVIFLLSRHDNLKYKEIAETLNISIKTVETQMGIALKKLRTKLRPFR